MPTTVNQPRCSASVQAPGAAAQLADATPVRLTAERGPTALVGIGNLVSVDTQPSDFRKELVHKREGSAPPLTGPAETQSHSYAISRSPGDRSSYERAEMHSTVADAKRRDDLADHGSSRANKPVACQPKARQD